MSRPIVVIESPLKGDYVLNKRYALWCLRDSLERGEAPFASHLLYTQVLDDRNPEHRELGITAGHSYYSAAEIVAFYTDLGMSEGMNRAADMLAETLTIVSKRKLNPKHLELCLGGHAPEAT